MKPIAEPVVRPIRQKRIAGRDIVLNVSFQDSMIRLGILLLLPVLVLLIDKDLIIYTAPVIGYLFVTAVIQFCVIKYVWHRYIKHDPALVLPEYGKDPNYPEESI